MEDENTPRPWQGVLLLLLCCAVLGAGVLVWGADIRGGFLLCLLLCTLWGKLLGWSWQELEELALAGMGRVLPGVLSLLLLGAVTGVWMEAGVLPCALRLSLKLPLGGWFLPGCAALCALWGLLGGSAWACAAILGPVLLSVGAGCGLPPEAVCGAVVSGAYCGEQLSPRSEAANLAAAAARCPLGEHLRFLLPSALLPFGISLLAYGLLNRFLFEGVGAELESELGLELEGLYTLRWELLLPLGLTALLGALGLPLLLTLGSGLLSGALAGLLLQPGCSLPSLFRAACFGPGGGEGGSEALAELLSRGGLDGFLPCAALLLLFGAWFGLLEGCGFLRGLGEKRTPGSPGGLVAAAEGLCLLYNALLPEQYLSLLLSGGLFTPAREKLELHPKSLSCALASSGAVLSPLVPWSNCGIFLYGLFGLSALRYAPWAFFNLLCPVCNLLLALLGLSVAGQTGVRLRRQQKQAEAILP